LSNTPSLRAVGLLKKPGLIVAEGREGAEIRGGLKVMVEEENRRVLEWDDVAVDKDGKEYKIHFEIHRNEINMEIFDKLEEANS